MRLSKSMPLASVSGNMTEKSTCCFCSNDFQYLTAFSSVMNYKFSSSGVPITFMIYEIWSLWKLGSSFCLFFELGLRGNQYLPGKSGSLSRCDFTLFLFIAKTSAKIHPRDQISTGVSYSFSTRITSGARYHRVTTCAVSYRFLLRTNLSIGLGASVS